MFMNRKHRFAIFGTNNPQKIHHENANFTWIAMIWDLAGLVCTN